MQQNEATNKLTLANEAEMGIISPARQPRGLMPTEQKIQKIRQ